MYGLAGKGPALGRPCGVCVTPDDTILVADYANNRLQELRRLGHEAPTLLGVGLLQSPLCVAVTRDEDAVVVRQDGGSNRVVVLARDGCSLLRVLLTSADVAHGYHGLSVSRSGVVAAADYGQRAVVVCGVDGTWKRTIDAAALGSPLGRVYGAGFDSREQLWTYDRKAKCLVIMEPK